MTMAFERIYDDGQGSYKTIPFSLIHADAFQMQLFIYYYLLHTVF